MVWKNCKVEGNSSESSNSVRWRRKKIWNTKEGVANISKEEYFLPSLIAKANLAPDIRQVCDLWHMEPPSILLICYRWLTTFQYCIHWGQSTDVLCPEVCLQVIFQEGPAIIFFEPMSIRQRFSISFPHDWL